MSTRPIKRALVSVYDKTGLVELAKELSTQGVEIVSTGSTAATIASEGIGVTQVADLTDFPEMLGNYSARVDKNNISVVCILHQDPP